MKRLPSSLLAAALAVVFAHATIAGVQPDDPQFDEFRQKNLRLVGRKVLVVGTLDSSKLGWWLSAQEWGFYIYMTTTNRADLEKMNGLDKFRGHRVMMIGNLRHWEYRVSGNPLVPSLPEHFFFDVAEVSVSDVKKIRYRMHGDL